MYINNNIQISTIILLYQFIAIILYYTIGINKKFLSWTLLINIFIILVVIFCRCNLPINLIIIILLIKIIFLIIILHIVDFSLNDYLISLLVLIIYYSISDIDKIYSCNIKFSCLLMSIVLSTFIYLYNMILYKK